VFGPSAYSQQTLLTVPRLKALGHEVAIAGGAGAAGAKQIWQGIPIFPPGHDRYATDIAAAHAQAFNADILISLFDAWVPGAQHFGANGVRWVPYAPIDSEPLSPFLDRYAHSYQPIVMSKFGERVAQEAGIDTRYAPHMIDTDIFKPGSRSDARELFGWPQDAFIVGIVAANRGHPVSRKALPQQIEAFSVLKAKHPDAILYLHMFKGDKGEPHAFPLPPLIEALGLEIGKDVLFADPYRLNAGYPVEVMADLYRGMDVLSSVSMGEGFGVPIVEAQAVGIPVVVGDWSSMSELCLNGWFVEQSEAIRWWYGLENWQYLPLPGAIAERLEAAYAQGNNRDVACGAKEIARIYDCEAVTQTYWKPLLEELAERIAAEPTRRPHKHVWAKRGIMDSTGVLYVPCDIRDCPAELELAPNGEQSILDHGGAIIVDDIALKLADNVNGSVARFIASEITDRYELDRLRFSPGDVILDIGAHVGVVSCYLGKKWPQVTIYAFEPWPENYARLKANIDANEVANVKPFDLAVSADGRELILAGDPNENSGGMSSWTGGVESIRVKSVTLSQILGLIRGPVRLLKLDCEGAEYEVITPENAPALSHIAALRGEIHTNATLRAQFGAPERLRDLARAFIPDVIAHTCVIPDPPAPEFADTIEARTIEARV
jgi:FkbM family methyltransferase